MNSNPTNESSERYSIIIVGCGPSSIGLLYGLLKPYDIDHNSSKALPNFNIAIIEQGPKYGYRHNKPFTKDSSDPVRFFHASHGNPLHTFYNKRSNNNNTVTMYKSTPQVGLSNRVIDVPVGMGRGGGTNINACLLTKPSSDDFESWPMYYKQDVSTDYSQVSEKKTINPNLETDSRVKYCRMMKSVDIIFETIKSNGASTSQSNSYVSSSIGLSSQGNENDNIFHSVPTAGNLPSFTRIQDTICACRYNPKTFEYSRVNYYDAVLKPFLERNPHLKAVIKFFYETCAERLIVKKKTIEKYDGRDKFVVIGVEVSSKVLHQADKNKYFTILGDNVILCAGAILSPALLMVSGIGDQAKLQSLGITPLLDIQDKCDNWKSVGLGLRDHIIVPLGFLIPPETWPSQRSINGERGWIPLDIPLSSHNMYLKSRCFIQFGDGSSFPYVMPHVLASFIRRRKIQNHTDHQSMLTLYMDMVLEAIFQLIRFILTIFFQYTPLKFVINQICARTLISVLNPYSQGFVTVQVTNSNDNKKNKEIRLSDCNIHINPNYLTDERDIKLVEAAWDVGSKLTATIFPKGIQVMPGPIFKYIYGDMWLRHYSSNFGLPYFHWSGTCRMETENDDGIDEKCNHDYVINHEMKVRGFDNLYVCDASSFPSNVSGPLSLTCAALGFTFATLLNKELIDKKL